MRKWLLIAIPVILLIVYLVVIHQQELTELLFHFVDEPEPTEDGSIWEGRITGFEGGATAADRDFLIRKLMAFSAAAKETSFGRLAYKYYYEDFAKMAGDGTLDARENRQLRELYSEVLSEAQVEQWFKERGRLVIGTD
ncbi:MAG TPA: hypothetical protein VMX35_12000 [Acidobacteriota bacterium]|nr:hypothetical protein [Acidobacteriota bacterium]